MKKILLAMLMAKSFVSFSQTVCNPSQQISTNPASPVNTQKPTLVNHFDWTTASFPLRAEQLTSTTIASPFYVGPWDADVADLVDSKDRLPADGWELINADFGYNNNGTPAASKVIDPKLLLYNRYTSTFRLFFAKGHTTTNDYNFIKINLLMYPNSGQYFLNTLELNNNGGILMPLDISNFKTKSASFSFMKDFAQTPATWVYSDFPMHYDPCTCFFQSRIKVQIKYITTADVDLTGTFNGQLAAINNGQGSVTNPSLFTPDFFSINSGLNTISKAYKTIDGFTNDVKNVNTNYGALTNMNSALKNSNFLKSAFSSFPFIDLAIGFINFFTGGGKSAGPQSVALTPTSIDLSGKITGSITNEVLNTEGIFITPGSDPTGSDDTKYPIYSQPFGVLAITKTPKLKWYTSLLLDNSSDCCFTDVVRNDVVLDRATTPIFEYALNPGCGLHLQEAQAAIVFEYTDSHSAYNATTFASSTKGYRDNNQSGTYHPTLVFDGYNPATSTYNYRTAYYPMECLAGNVFNFETTTSSDFASADNITHVYLKLKLNLARNVGTGQNVLLVQTYDITPGLEHFDWDRMRNVLYPPAAGAYNYSVKPEPVLNTCGYTGTSSNWQPITATRLSTICHSTTYANGHLNTLTTPRNDNYPQTWKETNAKASTVSTKDVHIFPNPSSKFIGLTYPASIESQDIIIMNALGQTFSNVNCKVSQIGNNTSSISCDISQLPIGSYFLVIQKDNDQPESFKFIKN